MELSARELTRSARLEVVALAGTTRHGDRGGATRVREGLLVRVLDDGLVGLGEASPLPGHSRELLVECRSALSVMGPRPWSHALDRLPMAARFALETALLDLEAQRAGLPLHRLLGDAQEPRGIVTQEVVSVDDTSAAIERAVGRGARAVKLKVGVDAKRDAEMVAAARSLDRGLVVRVDANEAGIGPVLGRAIERADVDFCEDPCAVDALGSFPFRVAIDVRPDAIEHTLAAVAGEKAAVLVLKPTVLGGLRASMGIARRARALGARIVVSHALESPIALAACAHLALAIGAGEIHGLGHHAGLHTFTAGGRALPVPDWIAPHSIEPSTTAGLG